MGSHIQLVLLLLVPSLVLAYKAISSADPGLVYSGRFDFDIASAPSYDWSGVEILTTFTGTSLSVLFNDSSNYYNVFIDGNLVSVVAANKDINVYNITSSLSSASHSLRITKRTEPDVGKGAFLGLHIDDSATVTAPTLPQRRIEFIGDSITCGYGNEGTPPCPFTGATEDNWQSYGPMTATALQAEYHLEAFSGMGMVRNYGDPNITSAVPFPALWNRTLCSETAVYDFKWKPQAVVINLGTNDYSSQPYPPQDVFETGYHKFMAYVRSVYGSDIQFFLVCGPMISGNCCTYVQNVASSEQNATFVNMQGILSSTNYGCNGHPNVSGHQKMAAVATPIISKVMNWD